MAVQTQGVWARYLPEQIPSVDRYLEIRDHTEGLAEPLSAEDQTVQTMPDVSPTKWHRAHTTWFWEEFVLGPNMAGFQPFHPAYRYLFNSYYETVGARHARPERGLLTRPGIAEIAAYRRRTDELMCELLSSQNAEGAATIAELGLNHEQQHQELILMDIKHVLWCNPLKPPYRSAANAGGGEAPAMQWVHHPGGLVDIGHDGAGFAFDNEGPRHRELLRPFLLADRPISSGEWLAFMHDGGYERPELWMSDGWAAVKQNEWCAPLYWINDGGWSMFTLTGVRPIDPAEPVCHVSWYEADAFARWSDARLPLEAEWEAVHEHSMRSARVTADRLHPDSMAGREGSQVGEVWEWTASPYSPYPGFHPAAGAVGEYNGKFMVNQFVLRGSACVTPPGHARATYRNFFPPSARWAFSGLRLARDV